MNGEINDLKEDIPQLKDFNDEYLFTIAASKYYYFEGEFNFINFENCFTDGKYDGGIDLVTITDSPDVSRKELLLIQGKMINKLKTAQDAVDIFTKMAQTVNDFKNKKTGKYNDRLKKILTVNLEAAEEEEALNIRLVLFLDTQITKRMKTEIKKRATSSIDLIEYELDIFPNNEILDQINISKDNRKYIEKETINFYKEHGLEYTDNGILVNISSNSLRRLDNIYKALRFKTSCSKGLRVTNNWRVTKSDQVIFHRLSKRSLAFSFCSLSMCEYVFNVSRIFACPSCS